MLLKMLRSKRALDRVAISSVGKGWAHGAENNDGLVHTNFDIDDYPGETPHARVSIDWNDVEALIDKFSQNGHPAAVRLLCAIKLASAVEELVKISN